MEAFQSSSLQNFKRFSFLLFSMHFIFGLNQMFPCFAELIICLRASPSHLAHEMASLRAQSWAPPKPYPITVLSWLRAQPALLKKPIGPSIEVHDVKLNISIVGR
jgi:hypothetical protein